MSWLSDYLQYTAKQESPEIFHSGLRYNSRECSKSKSLSPRLVMESNDIEFTLDKLWSFLSQDQAVFVSPLRFVY